MVKRTRRSNRILNYSVSAAVLAVLVIVYGHVAMMFTDSFKLKTLKAQALATDWRGAYVEGEIGGDDAKAALSRLETVARYVLGFKLDYVEELAAETGNYGQTMRGWHPDGSAVRATQITAELQTNARAHILAHEIGHMLQPPGLMKGPESEVFAETVAFLVMERLGLHTLNESAAYLSQYKASLGVIDVHRRDLEWAVTVIAGD
jgi:hypothetical protein